VSFYPDKLRFVIRQIPVGVELVAYQCYLRCRIKCSIYALLDQLWLYGRFLGCLPVKAVHLLV